MSDAPHYPDIEIVQNGLLTERVLIDGVQWAVIEATPVFKVGPTEIVLRIRPRSLTVHPLDGADGAAVRSNG